MTKIKVGVDIDDTLCDTGKFLIDSFNAEHGTSFRVEDMGSEYYVQDFLANQTSHSYDYCNEKVFEYFDRIDIGLYDGVVHNLRRLSSFAELSIVTARSQREFGYKTQMWLNLCRINTFFSDLGFIHKSRGVEGNMRKVDYCLDKGIECIIEDASHHAKDCAEAGVDVILFNRPWNQDLNGENVYRVNTWNEIPNVVLGIKNRKNLVSTPQ